MLGSTRGAAAGLVGTFLFVVAGGCGGVTAPEEPASDATGAVSDRADLVDADLWLSFEDERVASDGSKEFLDARDARFAARVVTANGGTVVPVAGADGRGEAVEFPERCTSPSGCPRAMVEVPADEVPDPGTLPFSFGAVVWLAADQTTVGSNIVQKGRYGSAGGQWKLQVDGLDGRASCVVRSGADVQTVKSSVTVADGSWHRVTCRRDAGRIGISVDGTVVEKDVRTGSVSNSLPLRIGSPGVGDSDDQFHGRIDDVFLTIDK